MVDAKDQETCQVKKKNPALIFLCSVFRQPLSGARTRSPSFPGSSKLEEIFLNGSTRPLKIRAGGFYDEDLRVRPLAQV
jgi:hypothetical protein